MTADNISVTVDFANTAAGSYTLKANIIMAEGFESVGAMGNYTISATVQETGEGKDAKK